MNFGNMFCIVWCVSKTMIDLLGNCLVFVLLFEQCGNVVFLVLIGSLGRFRLSGVAIYTY